MLWEAFFQRKQCYSPKIKHFCPPHKFLGWLRHWVRRIFARVTQTCPKSFSATFAFRFLSKRSWKTFLWYDLQRRSSCAFLQTLGTNFSNQTTLGAIFFLDLQGFCPDFQRFYRIFDKSKLLEVRLHLASYSTAFVHGNPLLWPYSYIGVTQNFDARFQDTMNVPNKK